MRERAAKIIFWLTPVIILGVMNAEIVTKENIVRDGNLVLLELGPRDPRSLMQGDYMVLRYRVADTAGVLPADGQLVLSVNENNIGEFQRVYEGSELGANEMLLKFRNHRHLKIGAESYFFEEGSADELAAARYGELRVAPDGSSVLIGLRDENFQSLGSSVVSPDATGLIINRK